jgi:hypothetical protein
MDSVVCAFGCRVAVGGFQGFLEERVGEGHFVDRGLQCVGQQFPDFVVEVADGPVRWAYVDAQYAEHDLGDAAPGADLG